jgi:hypothetical protein
MSANTFLKISIFLLLGLLMLVGAGFLFIRGPYYIWPKRVVHLDTSSPEGRYRVKVIESWPGMDPGKFEVNIRKDGERYLRKSIQPVWPRTGGWVAPATIQYSQHQECDTSVTITIINETAASLDVVGCQIDGLSVDPKVPGLSVHGTDGCFLIELAPAEKRSVVLNTASKQVAYDMCVQGDISSSVKYARRTFVPVDMKQGLGVIEMRLTNGDLAFRADKLKEVDIKELMKKYPASKQ